MRGRSALHDLADRSGGRQEVETIDVVTPETIAALRQRLAGRRFDVLFVVVGVGSPRELIATVTTEEFNRIMMTNALGPMRAVEALADLVSPNGVIGVMSSGLGSIAGNESGGWEVYRASKAALAMLMRSFAARHSGDGRGFVVIAQWVRTDMGGPHAPLGVEDSVPGIADAIVSQAGSHPFVRTFAVICTELPPPVWTSALHPGEPILYRAVMFISTCEDNAADDGNAQIPVIRRCRGGWIELKKPPRAQVEPDTSGGAAVTPASRSATLDRRARLTRTRIR